MIKKWQPYALFALCLIIIAGLWLYSLSINLSQNKNNSGSIFDLFKDIKLDTNLASLKNTTTPTVTDELLGNLAEKIKNLDTWQTYRNEAYGFEFKYPKENFSFLNETKNLYIQENGTYNYPFHVQINQSEYNNLEDFLNQFNDAKWKTNNKDKIEKINLFNTTAIKITSYDIPQAPNFISYHFLKNGNHIVLNLMYLNNEFSDNEIGEKILSTFKFIDSTAGWQTYRNEEYGFEFKYPKNYSLSDLSTNKSVSFDTEGPGTGLNIEIKKESSSDKINELKQTEQSLGVKIFNEKNWTMFYHEGKGMITGLWYTAIAQLDNENIIIVILNRSGTEELFNQILSTFKFIE